MSRVELIIIPMRTGGRVVRSTRLSGGVAQDLDQPPYLSSHTSSMRQPLKLLLTMIVSPLTKGCQQVAPRG